MLKDQDLFKEKLTAEIKMGLALLPGGIPEGLEIDDLELFCLVDDLYQEAYAKQGCWMCNPNTDPHEEPFTEQTRLCLTCQAKMRQILKVRDGIRSSNRKLQ